MRRVVILGADGFIGSHLTRAAASSGARVTAVCVNGDWRLRSVGGIERVRVPGGAWWSTAFEPTLRRCLRNASAIALLAYSPPPDRTVDAWEDHERSTNVAGAARVVGLAAEHGARVVLASSSDVYGTWHERPISERTSASPRTPYARAKVISEQLARQVPGSCSLRIATVFGPGEHGPRAIPSFIRAYLRGDLPVIHGQGSDIRDYIHVRDVARAFLAACLRSDPAPEALNIGSGVGRSTIEVLEAVAAVLDRRPEARHVISPRPAARVVLDPHGARASLNFVASERFATALAEEARWLKAWLSSSPARDVA
jgi:UDP-glucose 4-epimerase